jgi:carbon monoxide dehydrogenase subunit G
MEMTGEYRIPAPREAVWAALNDPDILKACIPGCEELTRTADDAMTARVVAKVGPVKATFVGDVTFTNVVPPSSYTIRGEGKGGVAGFAKGGADVTLDEDGEGTLLRYVVNAQVGGKLAQLGGRLVDTTAKQMADSFFGAFAARLTGGATPMLVEPALDIPEDDAVATEEAVDRAEHRVDDLAQDLTDTAEIVEEDLEVAAGRGFLGGPYVWGLIVILIGVAALAILRK